MKILITGSSGMLGGYLIPLLKEGYEVTTLQRNGADICCDLTKDTPDFSGMEFDIVIHAAGTADDSEAIDLNLEGTRRITEALSENPPKEFVYLSSWEVYSPDSGEDVGEDHQLWAASKTGQSKALAEELLTGWCAQHDVLLTILRPARMFGKGIKGEMATLFNDVAHSRYIHVRGNDTRISVVCASDVAEAILKLHPKGGIYNLTDGIGASWLKLAEAMSANTGAMKRQITLPEKWADAAWKTCRWLPPVAASLSPQTLARRSKTMTLSDSRIRETLKDWNPYPVLDVISRQCDNYPYLD